MSKGQTAAMRKIAEKNPGKVFNTDELKELVAQRLGVDKEEITIIPSDYCLPKASALFEKVGNDQYKCLSNNNAIVPSNASITAPQSKVKNNSTNNANSMPIINLISTYFDWVNRDYYVNTKLDNIAEHVIKFPNIGVLRDVYVGLNSINNLSVEKCKVKFVSPDEIREYEKSNTETIEECINIINRLLERLSQCSDFLPSNLINKISELLDDLARILKSNDISNGSIKEYSERLKQLLAAIADNANSEVLDLCDLIAELIEKLKEIQVVRNLLGVYLYNSKTILLCLKNIYDAAIWDGNVKVEDLAESVLVHEYTHHVHMSVMTAGQIISNQVYYDAVLETVAETVQYLYAEKVGNSALILWMQQHSDSGVFPGWGYAGESILRGFAARCKKNESTLLDIVIELSLSSCNNAYSMIQIISKATALILHSDYCIFSNDKNIWIFSKICVPYPSTKKLNKQQSGLKTAIQKALSAKQNTTKNLFAEFAGKVSKNSDIENWLFYNVKGGATFAGIGTIDFQESKDFCITKKGFYYYHYAFQNSVKPIKGNLLCKWDNFQISKIVQGMNPYFYFAMMKANSGKINTSCVASDSDDLCLVLTITAPKGLNDVALVMKPMIDGIICALHNNGGINIAAVSQQISNRYSTKKLKLAPSVIANQLNNNTNTCLFAHKYVYLYRNGVKWNPADDLLKYVRVEVKEGDTLSISGKLFKM